MTVSRLVSLICVYVLALAASGCSTGSPDAGGAGPCDEADPAADCGSSCGSDGDCSSGFHCRGDGTCTAECTPGGGECAGEEQCDNSGRCVDRGSTPDDDCPAITLSLEPVIPTVWLVIDRSGSMSDDLNGVSRWDAVREALVGANGVVTRLADRVVFGASLYTSTNGNAGGVCPNLSESSPQLDNFDSINTLLRSNEPEPEGDTPTSESVAAVAASFPADDPDAPSPGIIVLATDGDPDTCVNADDHGPASRAMSESAVEAAYTDGKETFVLSVGDQINQTHLQRLADIGIGEAPGAGVGIPYVANSPGELAAAFEEIIRGARTCEFVLEKEVDVGNQCQGTVTVNGVTLECGTDWRITDPTTLELLGGACDTFLNEIRVELDAEFPCAVVVL